MRRTTGGAALVAAIVLTACGAGPEAAGPPVAATTQAATASELPMVTVHKTATCECCGQYEDYLAANGVDVEVVVHDDVAPLKDDFGVPADQRSCHTNEVAGYFVEGHVPVEAIAALLAQAPAVDGIALAGMPSGSPGMPGEQTEPFVVTMSADGAVVGELGRF